MNLFDADSSINLLPYQGIVNYYGCVIPPEKAANYFHHLLEKIEWKPDEAVIYGKHIVTKRKVAWYGDKNYAYTYSNRTKQALLWTPELKELKIIAEKESKSSFNSCLLNLYHSGDEGMTWHSDDEKEMGKNATIASISFGAEREFCFKHKMTGEIVSTQLEHGSLLVMKGTTQTHWLHSLPKRTKIKQPRINLTFRTILEIQKESEHRTS